jgi:hypothetical protein
MKRKIQLGLKVLFFLLLMTAASQVLQAQNLEVTGVITEAGTDETLIGATVLVKGTTTGTVSDVSGQYKISVPQGATHWL